VLPDRIGHVVIRDDVPNEIVREALGDIAGLTKRWHASTGCDWR
jgi:hypothetical protein